MERKGMELETAPLRSLDDFLLESARFQIPNFKDFEKWGNRVVNNLLYYQTNYFLLSIVIFIFVGVLHPVQMLSGMLAMAVAFGMFYYFTNAKRSATQFKKEHPILNVLMILSGCCFIVYMLGSLVVFLLGILLPIMVTFIHASMRLRNMKNKLINKMEVIGLKRTPMGVLLEALGALTEEQIEKYIEDIVSEFEQSYEGTQLVDMMFRYYSTAAWSDLDFTKEFHIH